MADQTEEVAATETAAAEDKTKMIIKYVVIAVVVAVVVYFGWKFLKK
jgi:purine-cytosine permease-like protein